jgi:hypothetical protein
MAKCRQSSILTSIQKYYRYISVLIAIKATGAKYGSDNWPMSVTFGSYNMIHKNFTEIKIKSFLREYGF